MAIYVMTDDDNREIRRVNAPSLRAAYRKCGIRNRWESNYTVEHIAKHLPLCQADIRALRDDACEMGPAVPFA